MTALRPYLRLFATRRWRLAGGALMMLLTVIAAVGLLALSGWFITATAITAAVWATGSLIAFDVYVPGSGIRFFALLRTVSRYAERLYNHDMVLRILADLRGGVFAALARLDPGTLARFRAAELLNRLTADIDTLDNLYLRLLAPPAVTVLASAAVAGLLALFVPIAGIAAAVLLALLCVLVTAGAAGLGWRASECRVGDVERLRTGLIEHVQGLAELTAYGSRGRHRDRLRAREADLLAQQHRLGRMGASGAALVTFGIHAVVAIVLLLGAVAFRAEDIAGPVMALMPLAVLALGEGFAALPAAFLALGGTVASARRLNTQARLRTAVPAPAEPVARPAGSEVRFERVTLTYPGAEAPALAAVDLAVAAGEHVAVVGASGAGKSTLAQLVARLADPDAGTITIGGVPVARLAPEALRERVAYLTQRTELFHDSIAGNLRIAAPQASDTALWQALHVAGLNEFVRRLPSGLDTWIGESGRQLSGGEGRRLALARVVLRDAPIVLLDEPLAGLDGDTAEVVAARLADWLQGRTALSFAHDSDALPPCHRVVRVADGSLR